MSSFRRRDGSILCNRIKTEKKKGPNIVFRKLGDIELILGEKRKREVFASLVTKFQQGMEKQQVFCSEINVYFRHTFIKDKEKKEDC